MTKWPVVLTMASACLPMAVDARQATSTASSLSLEPMSHADAEQGGAAGTGCSWSLAKDRRMRFAAADDRAVVRLASGIVRLRPADPAGDLFPFTYDRWAGDGVTVTVTPIGPSRWKGTEVNEGAADIEVRNGGRRWIARGRLTCGS
ncbi:hypothetical protein [Sphingomonas sp. Leaf21]|uniref:hypothetical protein n=1 Tax=Sphingomonas sp. Leaf21 TaxID=2876550 RepID=UPI001E4AFD26|nr:hypothetical protein [Sphingomonas sp. Leaf21]